MSKPVKLDLKPLTSFFQDDPNVVLAVVFGSAAEGNVAPGSDLDIGVLFETPPSYGESYLDYYFKICSFLPDTIAVDLVNLNQANTILAFEALSGCLLCKNDPEKAAGFASLTSREYEDIMGNLEHQRRLNNEAA